MNFNQLRVFDALARQRSFSKAAAELSLSQPTASVHIQNLEQELGIKLVEQLGKALHLTPAGDLLFTYTRRIFSLANEATRAMEELKDKGKGKLQIGASTTPGTYLLPLVLSKYKTLYSQVDLHFEVANSALITEKVAGNQLDFGLVGHSSTKNEQLTYTPLWDDTLAAIFSPQNALAGLKHLTPFDLHAQGLIMREQGSGTRRLIEQAFAKFGVELSPAMEFAGTEGVKQAVIANLGVSIVSKSSVSYEEQAGVLVVMDIPELELRRQFYLVHHKDKTITPLAENFIFHLKQAANA
jgi:DNA-binding transcriptional LysR family regulator